MATARNDPMRLPSVSTVVASIRARRLALPSCQLDFGSQRNPIRIARVLRFGRRLLGDLHRSMLENMGSYKDYPPQ